MITCVGGNQCDHDGISQTAALCSGLPLNEHFSIELLLLSLSAGNKENVLNELNGSKRESN